MANKKSDKLSKTGVKKLKTLESKTKRKKNSDGVQTTPE